MARAEPEDEDDMFGAPPPKAKPRASAKAAAQSLPVRAKQSTVVQANQLGTCALVCGIGVLHGMLLVAEGVWLGACRHVGWRGCTG